MIPTALTQMLLLGLVVLATLVWVPVMGLGLAAYLRRQSRSYLLVVLALGTLLARLLVAFASIAEVVPSNLHHLLEHGLDVIMAMLVVAAVYYARQIEHSQSVVKQR